jgi:hypothetical protein
MVKCNDCWCEHYGKNSSACDLCTDKHIEKDKPELRVLLNNRTIQQTDFTKTRNANEQSR